jgi:uncharacterized membrane protein YphA (DoxX/SURF4 family)
MNPILKFFLHERVGVRSRSTLAIRIVTGVVFLISGSMKFLFDNLGPGRFAKLGFTAPSEVSGFVATVEIVAGALLVVGLFVRLAAVPLMVDMLVALATTKVPLLFGGGPEIPSAPPRGGFWAFAYQARLDVTMLVACGYLVAVGAGLLSLDAYLRGRRPEVVRPNVARNEEPLLTSPT